MVCPARSCRSPAPLRPEAQLYEEHQQQVAVDHHLQHDQGPSFLSVLLDHHVVLSRPGHVAAASEGSRLAAATSRRAPATVPSELSGPRMQTSAASVSPTPDATRWAAVTSVRVEGGSRCNTSSAWRMADAHRTRRP